MKVFLSILCLFLCLSESLYSQTVVDSQASEEQEVSAVVEEQPFFITSEVKPIFQGGDINTFRSWVVSQFKYPPHAVENKIEGQIVFEFIVEVDGSLTNVKFLKSPDPVFESEIVRILQTSPKWTPGLVENKPVRVKQVIPIDCILGEEPVLIHTVSELLVDSTIKDDETGELIINVNKLPKFQNGHLNKFRDWVITEIEYPENSIKEDVEGSVIVEFVIEKDGSLSNIIFLQFPDVVMAQEVYRVLLMSPKWTPGEKDGKLVRVKHVLSIEFTL